MIRYTIPGCGSVQSDLGAAPINAPRGKKAQMLGLVGLATTAGSFLSLAGTHVSMMSSCGVAAGSSAVVKMLGLSALGTLLGTGGALAVLYIALLLAIVGCCWLIYKQSMDTPTDTAKTDPGASTKTTEITEHRTESALALGKMNPDLNEDGINTNFKDQQFFLSNGNNKRATFKGMAGASKLKEALGRECIHLLPQVIHLLATNGAIEASCHVRGLMAARMAEKHGADQVIPMPNTNQTQWTQTVRVDRENESVTIEGGFSTECSEMMVDGRPVSAPTKAKGTTTYTINQNGVRVDHNYRLEIAE